MQDKDKKIKPTEEVITKTKKVDKKPTKKEKVVIKINYKKEFEKLKKEFNELNLKKLEVEFENKKNIIDFKVAINAMQTKAQQQINIQKEKISKKLEEEREHIKMFGSQKLLESIIEPILNIELAINAGKNNELVSAYVIGFEMLIKQIYQEFESNNIYVIEPKIGSEFIPIEHEILNLVDGDKQNTITKIIKKGFKIHDRVVKPALIDVVK